MDESWDALQERHRSEIRALKARVMALKKSATQGDKKRKKEVTAEIGALEAELADRHAREEREFKAAHPPPASDAPAEAPEAADADAAAVAADPAETSSADADEAVPAVDAQSSAPRVTRAARRRVRSAGTLAARCPDKRARP